MPDNTSDLVALTQFLENASSVTVVNLQTAVDEAGERLLFLLEYATLPCMLPFFTHLIFPNLLVEFTHEVSCSSTVVSPTSRFTNVLFANFWRRFAYVLCRFPKCFRLISGWKNEVYTCVSHFFVSWLKERSIYMSSVGSTSQRNDISR